MEGRDTFLTINLLHQNNNELHYFNELIAPIAFDLVSSLLPSRSHDGQCFGSSRNYNNRIPDTA
jgi:hypothetical protein